MVSRLKSGNGSKSRRKTTNESHPHRTVLKQLAAELYRVIFRTLKEFGLSDADQRRLMVQMKATSHRDTPTSNYVLRRFAELGDLIVTWYTDTKYLDIDGKPRVLAVKGTGATFATLARRFLPGMSQIDAVHLACRAAEVGTLPGGKIALYGSTLVNVAKNAESALAHCIRHIAWLSETSIHNHNVSQGEGATGRIERIIGRNISAKDFEAFERHIRPQIHDLCERVDGMLLPLERSALRQRNNRCAVRMGIYLYAGESVKKVRRTSDGKIAAK